jgi:hypothetical protein
MGILEQILEEIEPVILDEQVREICDRIIDEEKEENYCGPDGPNVFLSLEAFKTEKEHTFLCLEREEVGKFIITKYVKTSLTGPLKRVQVWEIKEDKANKIIRAYAQKMRYIKGE